MISLSLGDVMVFNIIAVLIAVVVNTLLVKVLWRLVIPYIFPKAVKEGYIIDDISWLGAFGLVLFLGVVMGGMIRISN